MSARIVSLGLLLLSLFLATERGDAQTGVSALLIPTQGKLDVRGIFKHPDVLRAEFVFSGSEKKELRKLGQSDLAEARVLQLSGTKGFQRLRGWILKKRIPAELDLNSLGTPYFEPLEDQQWGIKNNGAAQRIVVDDISSYRIMGVPGEDLHLPMEETKRAQKIRVAVLDTGVDYSHPNLKGALVHDSQECQALKSYKECLTKSSKPDCDQKWGAFDGNKNGYPMDCSGWDVTKGRSQITDVVGGPDASDDVGHGTHLAGIIAAAANGTGVRGVSQNVEILPVKVITAAPNAPVRPQQDEPPLPTEKTLRWGVSFADHIARGMLYAIRSGAQVINMSLGWPIAADSILMRKMVALAVKRNIFIVAAAGNDSTDSRVFPCLYEGVICVASHGPDGLLSHFSNHGAFVDLAAPGLNILSTWPTSLRSTRFTARQGYELKNGTSMASPFVAGAVARLLAEGVPVEEVYPRLLIGSRSSSAKSIGSIEKTMRGGNLDIQGSLNAKPEPLILPEKKTVLQLEWDRKKTELSFSVSLKNYWASSSELQLRASLVSESGAEFSHLEKQDWVIPSWASGEVKKIDLTLKIDDLRVDGRNSLEFQIMAGGFQRKFRIPLEIFVVIHKDFDDPQARILRVFNRTQGASGGPVQWSPELDLRPVSAKDGSSTQDFLVVEGRGLEKQVRLLRQQENEYHWVADRKITFSGELLEIQKIDRFLDGGTSYVLIVRSPPARGSTVPSFRILYCDALLALKEEVVLDNQAVAFAEDFKWMRLEDQGVKVLVPAWIGFGKLPDSEKPAFDPWNPEPEERVAQRFYYIHSVKNAAGKSDVLHTYTAPESYTWVSFLARTAEQDRIGEIPAILSKGDGYQLDFFVARVGGSLLKTPSMKELSMPEFRMLVGAKNSKEALPLDLAARRIGTAFTSDANAGSRRTTLVEGGTGEAPRVFDQDLKAFTLLDSISRATGVFLGDTTAAVYAESHYRLQYWDLVSGEKASTSLDRFSFLPAFIFSRTFFPVVAETSTAPLIDRIGGIYIPVHLGSTDASEVIVPLYQDQETQRHLRGLSRPARLRLKAGENCAPVDDAVLPNALSPSALSFYCGDRFIQIPLSF